MTQCACDGFIYLFSGETITLICKAYRRSLWPEHDATKGLPYTRSPGRGVVIVGDHVLLKKIFFDPSGTGVSTEIVRGTREGRALHLAMRKSYRAGVDRVSSSAPILK